MNPKVVEEMRSEDSRKSRVGDTGRDISLPADAKLIIPGLLTRKHAGGLTGPKIAVQKMHPLPGIPMEEAVTSFHIFSHWAIESKMDSPMHIKHTRFHTHLVFHYFSPRQQKSVQLLL